MNGVCVAKNAHSAFFATHTPFDERPLSEGRRALLSGAAGASKRGCRKSDILWNLTILDLCRYHGSRKLRIFVLMIELQVDI
jgi:hypothetical protein